MLEIYMIIAVICNVIANMFVFREVKRMRKAHNTIMVDIRELRMGFGEFTQTLGPCLTDHADRVSKSVKHSIAHYQGKAEKAAVGEIEGLNDTLQALGPLAKLISKAPASGDGGGTGKFHV